jgi:hypothetical protein
MWRYGFFADFFGHDKLFGEDGSEGGGQGKFEERGNGKRKKNVSL